ncbi:hypothetical protein HPP92_020629 [Vanilla planifolia]|uniref:HMA domain-containing protein n=1 Tax=Vanilla planifolia TaxID=51239 RepID=A0A835Q410_VANPL|nr:hypothetical protein HPP92_020629 [Vanilla planifolia]
MGVLSFFSELCSNYSSHGSAKKRKQLQTVEIKVRMDCEGCERKVRRAVEGMNGVKSVELEAKQNKLTVTGFVDPQKVLKRVIRKTGKHAEPWPYVPYDMVFHPYAAGAYDKKAPPGYVRNVADDPKLGPLARASSLEEKCVGAFSDDNPNSCTIV